MLGKLFWLSILLLHFWRRNKMSLNSVKGNMYNWVTATRNYLAGECNHFCKYCYVNNLKERFPNIKKRYSGEIRLLEKELNKKEGSGKTIFVQDMSDLFAENVPKEFILKILAHCKAYPNNKYIFQTKNPKRFKIFRKRFPHQTFLGITLETNRDSPSKADSTIKRANDFSHEMLYGFNKFVTLEPLIDFDLKKFVNMIKKIKPEFVNIGADSKKNNLNEPDGNKVRKLIDSLKQFTDVRIKDNLYRILKKKEVIRR